MKGSEATSSAAFLDVSRELLDCGYQVRFQATGSSMHPTIRHQDVVTVAAADASAIKEGDIVLYRLDQRVIAHRVIRIERTAEGRVVRVALRGDWADLPDLPVEPDQILGRVVAVDRKGRHITLTGPWARLRQRVRTSLSKAKRAVLGLPPPADDPADE
jgi:hypothetical protein